MLNTAKAVGGKTLKALDTIDKASPQIWDLIIIDKKWLERRGYEFEDTHIRRRQQEQYWKDRLQ